MFFTGYSRLMGRDESGTLARLRKKPVRTPGPRAPQQAEALRSTEGFAPRPVATPDLIGPIDERILPQAG